METLPWLVVYGWTLWIVVLALFALLGFPGAKLVCRRIVKARRETANTIIGTAENLVESEHGIPTVIAGILGSDGAPITRCEDGGSALVTTLTSLTEAGSSTSMTASGLHFLVDGARVELDGDIIVELGSTEWVPLSSFRKLPLKVQRRITETFRGDEDQRVAVSSMAQDAVLLASLAKGDRVRAYGHLRKEAGDGEAYRDAASRWVLSSVPAEGDVERPNERIRVAFDGAPRVSGPSRRAVIKRSIFSVMLGLAFLYCVGWLALDSQRSASSRARQTLQYGRDCAQSPFVTAGLIAASTPFHRNDSILSMAYTSRRRCSDYERGVHETAALSLLADNCSSAAEWLLNHGEPARAEEVALRCQEREVARTLFALGLFEEASARLRPFREEMGATQYEATLAIQSFILSKNWRNATAAAKTQLSYTRDLYSRAETTAHQKRELLQMRCLREALERELEDDPNQGAALVKLATEDFSDDWSDACGSLLVASLDPADRIGVLEQLGRGADLSVRRTKRPREELLLGALALLNDDGELLSPRQRRGRFPPGTPEAVEFIPVHRERLMVHPSSFLRYPGRLPDGLDHLALSLLEDVDELSTRGRIVRASLAIADAEMTIIAGGGGAHARTKAARRDLAGLETTSTAEATELAYARAALNCVEIARAILEEQPEQARALLRDRPVSELGCGSALEPTLDFLEQGSVDPLREHAVDTRVDGAREGWQAAARGDARAIARVIEQSDIRLNRYLLIWALRTNSDEESFRRYVRWGRNSSSLSSRIRELFLQRAHDSQLARALGDEEWAAELVPILERFWAVYQDPEVAVFLRGADAL